MTVPARDAELVQLLDLSLESATRRAQKQDGSSWLACRPGCTSCCHGVFHISMLDAARLQAGLRELASASPARALAVRERARVFVAAMASAFPGDPSTGLLSSIDEAAWDTFADLPEADAPCPALHPETGTCELYSSRPLTCRVFGPPVLNESGLGMCELCYIGAAETEILQGEMVLTHHDLETELDREMPEGSTVIAWALLL